MTRLSVPNLVVGLRHPSLFFANGHEERLVKSLRLVSDEILTRARLAFEKERVAQMRFSNLTDYLEGITKSELARLDCIIDNPYYCGLYLLVRWLKPQTVVETGVQLGVSSKIILAALLDNGWGNLYSVDLPNAVWFDRAGNLNEDRLIRGYSTGHIVPRAIRSSWHLVIADSRAILPIILPRLQPIDIFVHDSNHSYEHMLFEFSTAWPHLKNPGLLVSDDADYNPAFREFGDKVNAYSHTFIKNRDRHQFGVISNLNRW